MKFLTKYAASFNEKSLASKKRNKRNRILEEMLLNLEIRNLKILDFGGTTDYWNNYNNMRRYKISPVIYNIAKNEIGRGNGYSRVVGKGAGIPCFKNKSFDVAFSNSVIEHIPDDWKRNKTAGDLRRIADYYFIQTPAFVFPVEPHFIFPLFHWLPKPLRIWLLMHFNLGWFERVYSWKDAVEIVNSIRILRKWELQALFPDGKIIKEYFLGIPKSYIIHNFDKKITGECN